VAKDVFMSDQNLKKFTNDDLKQFDGQSGHPLYIVFKGKIYDLSNSKLWSQGKHMGMHTISEDLAEAVKKAPHGEDNVFRFPLVGELAVITEVSTPLPEQKKLETPPVQPSVPPRSEMDRRTFLKLTAAAGGAVTLGALLASLKAGTFVPSTSVTVTWPIIKITNISQLTNLKPLVFYYPLTNTPNYLVKLGVAAAGGIGPEKDIVAFSATCQHLGCEYGFLSPGGSPVCNPSYKAAIPMGYCCCHGSQYDFTESAKVIGGPAPRPVPMVQLQLDSSTGDISAVSMAGPTIFGHGPPGTTDPKLVLQYDLQGGDLVTDATVLG